jgi:hypothetical protein
MNTNLVLIVDTGSRTLTGLEGFLESSLGDEYVVVSALVRDRADLMREIERIKPAVLVIEEIAPRVTPLDLIGDLREIQNMRVIVLNG